MRKGEPGRRTFYRVVVILGGGLAAAFVVLYTDWLPFFDLREIEVVGNDCIPCTIIKQLADFSVGDNLFRLPVRRACKSLSSLSWVKGVSIRRILPHRILIIIRERAAIGLIPHSEMEQEFLLLGEGGVILEKAYVDDFPSLIIMGVGVTSDTPGTRLIDGEILSVLEYLHEKKLDRVLRSVDFSDEAYVSLEHVEDVEIILGPITGSCPKIDGLLALLGTIDPKDYHKIDLRFGDEAILVPRKVVN